MKLIKSINLKNLNGKKVKLIWRIIWFLAKANIVKCKDKWMILKTRADVKLRNYNSIYKTLKNTANKKKANLNRPLEKEMTKLRTWKICLKKKWLFSSKSLNLKKYKTNNWKCNLMKREKLMNKWSRLLKLKLKKVLMAKNMLRNKSRNLKNYMQLK